MTTQARPFDWNKQVLEVLHTAVSKHELVYEKGSSLSTGSTCIFARIWNWIRGRNRENLSKIIEMFVGAITDEYIEYIGKKPGAEDQFGKITNDLDQFLSRVERAIDIDKYGGCKKTIDAVTRKLRIKSVKMTNAQRYNNSPPVLFPIPAPGVSIKPLSPLPPARSITPTEFERSSRSSSPVLNGPSSPVSTSSSISLSSESSVTQMSESPNEEEYQTVYPDPEVLFTPMVDSDPVSSNISDGKWLIIREEHYETPVLDPKAPKELTPKEGKRLKQELEKLLKSNFKKLSLSHF